MLILYGVLFLESFLFFLIPFIILFLSLVYLFDKERKLYKLILLGGIVYMTYSFIGNIFEVKSFVLVVVKVFTSFLLGSVLGLISASFGMIILKSDRH